MRIVPMEPDKSPIHTFDIFLQHVMSGEIKRYHVAADSMDSAINAAFREVGLFNRNSLSSMWKFLKGERR